MFDVDTGLCRLKIFGCSSSFFLLLSYFFWLGQEGRWNPLNSQSFEIQILNQNLHEPTQIIQIIFRYISLYFYIFGHIFVCTYLDIYLFAHDGAQICAIWHWCSWSCGFKMQDNSVPKISELLIIMFCYFSFSCTTSQLQRHEAAQHRTWAQVLDSAPSFFNAEFPARGKMWGSQVHAHFDLMQGQLLKSSRAAWSRTILGICKISNFSKPKA